jgi:hypothetical protein
LGASKMVRNKKCQFPSTTANDVFLFAFSVHTTHLLQPLDMDIYQSLKHHWSQILNANMKENIRKKPNSTNFYLTLNPAFIQGFYKK